MKKIGRGWQYTTYDLGNGRVLKKYNSRFIAYLYIFKQIFLVESHKIFKIPAYYRGCKETAVDSIKKITSMKPNLSMLGNPKFVGGLDYEQDKLKPLHDYFVEVSVEKGKRAIDAFVDFNKTLIKQRLIDKSFNIAKNFALDAHGRIILMDLGELYSSPVSIEARRRNRAWAERYVVEALPEALRDYFLEKMDTAFKM